MGIKANFNMDDIRRKMYEHQEKIIKSALAAYKMACLDMVNRAKSNNTYLDQTGNLRSSIGYVLYYNGAEVDSYFVPMPAQVVEYKDKYGVSRKTPGGDGVEGSKKGYEYAKQIAEDKNSKGIVAVVVAGMDYAYYVETQGNDVLEGSKHQFAGDLRKHLEDVNSQHGTKF